MLGLVLMPKAVRVPYLCHNDPGVDTKFDLETGGPDFGVSLSAAGQLKIRTGLLLTM